MTDRLTARLSLHLVDGAEAERIVARSAAEGDSWADDFPADGEVIGATAFLMTVEARGEQGPFGFYRITRTSDGKAIGGIGFRGRPSDGCAEVGYGLAPSARGSGYAAEALVGALAIAADHGATRVVAETDEGNVASRRTLERAGFRRVGGEGEPCMYEVFVGVGSEAS